MRAERMRGRPRGDSDTTEHLTDRNGAQRSAGREGAETWQGGGAQRARRLASRREPTQSGGACAAGAGSPTPKRSPKGVARSGNSVRRTPREGNPHKALRASSPQRLGEAATAAREAAPAGALSGAQVGASPPKCRRWLSRQGRFRLRGENAPPPIAYFRAIV